MSEETPRIWLHGWNEGRNFQRIKLKNFSQNSLKKISFKKLYTSNFLILILFPQVLKIRILLFRLDSRKNLRIHTLRNLFTLIRIRHRFSTFVVKSDKFSFRWRIALVESNEVLLQFSFCCLNFLINSVTLF